LRYHLISSAADIRPKRLQILEDLSFVHDRRANVLDESSGDVIVD